MIEQHPAVDVVWLPSRTLAQQHAIPQPVQRTYRPARYTKAQEPWVKAVCGFALPEGVAPVRGDVPRCDKCRELAT